jgi:hypothetical protein
MCGRKILLKTRSAACRESGSAFPATAFRTPIREWLMHVETPVLVG